MKKPVKIDLVVVSFMTKIQEQLTALESKMDTLLSRPLAQPAQIRAETAPVQQAPQQNAKVVQEQRQNQTQVIRSTTLPDKQKQPVAPLVPNTAKTKPANQAAVFQQQQANKAAQKTALPAPAPRS